MQLRGFINNNDDLRFSLKQALVLVTSRRRDLKEISNTLLLKPLSMEYCRKLFYTHYEFDEKDNEILNDVIELSAKLTIIKIGFRMPFCTDAH